MLYGSFHFDIPHGDRTGTDGMRAHLDALGWDQIFEGRPGEATALWTKTFDDGSMTEERLQALCHGLMANYGVSTPNLVLLGTNAPVMIGSPTPYTP